MFYRKFFAYFLLVLYGVPAAIGPHWHSHHHCALSDVACADHCDSDAAPHSHQHSHAHHDHAAQTRSLQTDSQDSHHCCNCDHSHANHDQGQLNESGQQAEAQHPLLDAYVCQDEDCDSCAICHFYASSQLIGLKFSPEELHSLAETVSIREIGQTETVKLLHLARGPPQSPLFA